MTIASITESVNPATETIDTMSTPMIVAAIQAEDAKVAAAVAAVGDAIAQLVDVAAARMQRGGRLIYVGAGTSGRLGVLDAAECPPAFSTQAGQVVGLIAGGAAALTQAIEGVEDDPARGRSDLAGIGVDADDTVLGIAASGHTPYVLGAVVEARAAPLSPAWPAPSPRHLPRWSSGTGSLCWACSPDGASVRVVGVYQTP